MSPAHALTLIGTLASALCTLSASDTVESGIYYPNSAQAPADIDSPDVDVELALGLDGLCWSEATTPIVFQIKNTSSEFLTGTIEIRLKDYEDRLIFSAPMEIGQNSLRRFSYGIDGVYSHVQFFECRIVKGTEILWQRTIDVGSFSTFGSYTITSGTGSDARPPLLAVSTETIKRSTAPNPPGSGGIRPALLRVKPWEVPDHDQILSPLGGIFFSEDIEFRDFTGNRLTGLARYLAHGGSIVVPDTALPWVEKLIAELPYDIAVGTEEPTPVGLGLVIPYTPKISSPPWTRNELTSLIASRPFPNYAGHFETGRSNSSPGPHATASILAISVFIIVYLIAAGPMLFIFKKAKRKAVVRLLIVIIGGASLATLSLGAFLRTSHGDVAWGSVTRVSEGGATQTAIFNLSSGGARNHLLDLSAPTATIDHSEILPQFRYYRDDNDNGGRTYNQEILAPIAPGPSEIALTPLGRKRVHARAPIPKVRPLKLSIRIVPPLRPNRRGLTVKISLENPNPFPLNNPYLLFNGQPFGQSFTNLTSFIPAEDTVSGTYTLHSKSMGGDPVRQISGYNGDQTKKPRPFFLPKLPHFATDSNTITLLATLTRSPHFQISGAFEETHGDHYLIQQFPFPKQAP